MLVQLTVNFFNEKKLVWEGLFSVCCAQCASLPDLTTLEWIDQQHCAKAKMGYISLSSNLNAIYRYNKLLLCNSENGEIA